MSTIKSVRVTKLFGYEGNDFTLNLVDDCQITFVYAFNGVGKTTLLKLIYAVIKQNAAIFRSINFESIILTFNQKEQLIVKRICGEESELPDLLKNDHSFITYELKLPKKLFGYQSFIEELTINGIPIKSCPEIEQFLDKLGTDILFANKDYGRVVRAAEEIDDFTDIYSETDYIPISIDEVNDLLQSRKKKILEDKEKIKEQYKDKGITKELVIGGILGAHLGIVSSLGILAGPFGIATSLAAATGVISSSIGLYNRKKRNNKEAISLEEIEKEYDREEQFLAIPLPDKIKYIQTRLKYYIKKDKNIEKKISLFEEIINSYNSLIDKELRINRESGKLEIKTTFSNSELLDPKFLSSGEKNLLLLYFHIIFILPDLESEDKTFVALIDEPEVSMHSVWLIAFVDSVEHINEVLNRKSNYQYIITTHSPGITFEKTDLMVELKRD